MERDMLLKELNLLALNNINSSENSSENEFNSVSDKWFDNLPLILCGPILRKVHYDSVSVWMAFKEEIKDVNLDVFEASNRSKNIFKFTTAPVIKLGKNLYITLATATSANPSTKLVSDTVYGYSVSFEHQGKRKKLSDKGILNFNKKPIESIAYAPYDFPTFCLPSDTINNLKIVHGSCRKPHGGKTDALRALDTMIEINTTNTKERPQLLCLTGDQIYADDVADSLLYLIQESSSKLFGGDESLPKGMVMKRYGRRHDIIKKSGFTTTDIKSHLVTFQEFITMYLFCFSETLWTSELPQIEELFPVLKRPDQNKDQIIKERYGYINNENKAIKSFKKCLPSVQKAIANVSSLMIFDDHEITDDWHIDKAWNENVLKNPLGRRILLNGLSAYAIFQDWGNDFSKYQSGKGLALLNRIKERITSTSDIHINALEQSLIPVLKQDDKKESYYLQSNFTWHHKHIYNSFQLVFLNTRTERQYFEVERPLGNLIKDLDLQVSPFTANKLLILVSSVPVFGNIPMEIGQERLRTSVFKSQKGMYPKDQETWSFSNKGFSNLINFISLFPKSLILSGDVHYGFTSYIRLWQKIDEKNYKLSEVVQSTSSALKNSSLDLHDLTINGKVPKEIFGGKPIPMELTKTTPYKMLKVTGYKSKNLFPVKIDNPRFENVQDSILNGRYPGYESFSFSELFQFTVNYMKNQENSPNENVFQKIRDFKSQQNKIFHNQDTKDKIHPVVVAKDNISLISFNENTLTNTIWLASGAFEKPDDKEAEKLLFPYVRHKIVFNNKFNKDELPINEFIKKSKIPK